MTITIPEQWVKDTEECVRLAQTKYKNTPLSNHWPEWEQAREQAIQTWLKANHHYQ